MEVAPGGDAAKVTCERRSRARNWKKQLFFDDLLQKKQKAGASPKKQRRKMVQKVAVLSLLFLS